MTGLTSAREAAVPRMNKAVASGEGRELSVFSFFMFLVCMACSLLADQARGSARV
jgi:hypothetical protein